MIKRAKAAAAALLACLAVAAPAEDRAPPLPSNPDEAIQCAVWATVVIADNEGADQGIIDAYTWAMYYFIGRYEGATQLDFGAAMLQAATAIDADPDSYDPIATRCEALWLDYLERAKTYGVEPDPQ